MESISDIKNKFQSLSLKEYADFCRTYGEDSRSGVQSLIKKAQKEIDKYNAELIRLDDMLIYERKYDEFQAICGIDEVGRGPLAGPVMAASVILPKGLKIPYVNDSKKLTATQREELYLEITDKAVAYSVGIVDNRRIDEINILQATYEAMRQAVGDMAVTPDLLLNDAVTIPGLMQRQVPIIKGDAKSLSIASASIVAKVTRDRYMTMVAEKYPEYGFEKNKGYGSAEHIEALKKYGPTDIHRRTFIGNFI